MLEHPPSLGRSVHASPVERPIYRNGHDPERKITTPAGSIPFGRPRLRGVPCRSASSGVLVSSSSVVVG